MTLKKKLLKREYLRNDVGYLMDKKKGMNLEDFKEMVKWGLLCIFICRRKILMVGENMRNKR
jgi:hypothetical protein